MDGKRRYEDNLRVIHDLTTISAGKAHDFSRGMKGAFSSFYNICECGCFVI